VAYQNARDSLLLFGGLVFPEVEIGNVYLAANFHQIIARELRNWNTRADYPNLLIMAPPRHGKSQIVSRFLPSHLLGQDPRLRIIATSYSGELSNAMGRDVQALMLTGTYARVFPDTKLSRAGQRDDTAHRSMSDFDVIGYCGHYIGRGVGGGITGRGAHRIIIDDPVKNREQAESKTRRETVWKWYTSTLRTRLQKGGRIVLLMTRWHEDDLAGRLLRQCKEEVKADRWKVISFPALFARNEYTHPDDKRAEGEPLWPEMYDLAYLERTKATLGTYDWEALYQQQPRPAGGAVIQRGWIQQIQAEHVPPDLFWVRAWDLAVSKHEKADYTASGQMALDQYGNIYVRRFIRERMTWPETRRQIIAIGRAEQCPIGLGGPGLSEGFVQDLQAERQLADIAVLEYPEDKDKLTRALPWVARAEAGKFFAIQGAGLDQYIEELVEFTGQGDTHDDQVDWTSGAYRMLATGEPATEVVIIPDWMRQQLENAM